MSYITGPLLFIVGLATIFFAHPKKGKTTWVSQYLFIGDYLVAAVFFVVLGVCIAALK
jgi:hypothetical protein